MLKTALRVIAALVGLLCCLFSFLSVRAADEAFPAQSQGRFSFKVGAAQLSKDELVAGLDAFARDQGVDIIKEVPNPENFHAGKDLVLFGSRPDYLGTEVPYTDPWTHGTWRGPDQLGSASLDGTFLIRGDRLPFAELRDWAAARHLEVDFTAEKSAALVLQMALVSTGAWVPALTSGALLLALALMWSCARSTDRRCRLQLGVRSASVLATETVSLLKAVAPPLVAGTALGLFCAVPAAGEPWLWGYALLSMGAAAALGVLVVAAYILVAAASWPSVKQLTSRRPSIAGHRFAAQAVAWASLFLVVTSLPAVGHSTVRAFEASRDLAQWSRFGDFASVRVRGSLENAAVTDPALARVAREHEREGGLFFSQVVDPEQLPPLGASGFDAVVIVNRAYAEQAGVRGGGRLVPVEDTRIGPSLKAELEAVTELWLRPVGYGEKPGWPFSLVTAEAGAFTVIEHQDKPLRRLEKPLILVTDAAAEAFKDGHLVSLMTTGNVLFGPSEQLSRRVAASEAAPIVLSVDRVADTALAESRRHAQTAWMNVIGLLLALVALVFSAGISAWTCAAVRAQRIAAQRRAGWAWAKILARRVVGESAVAVILSAGVALAGLAFSGTSGLWALGAVPLFVLVSGASLFAASRAVFEGSARRRS
ncbi:hypothetical protein [Arthrobacter sp. UM1]|uniref:hypothetical protein n=1 Tax=Arthrobacter sp. UM1 TaxID=2766776 RepID=UPI001CF67B98|nr:hypothetical protein [Arthrobacter sp. UM1]MCB4208083.1 hypothetical protein [Arthrobacter sp. UM1]